MFTVKALPNSKTLSQKLRTNSQLSQCLQKQVDAVKRRCGSCLLPPAILLFLLWYSPELIAGSVKIARGCYVRIHNSVERKTFSTPVGTCSSALGKERMSDVSNICGQGESVAGLLTKVRK
jgi:hypothetical protein